MRKDNNITPLFASKILSSMYDRGFTCQSCDPKWNAQQNLSGRTHWADDSTLRFFGGRISFSADFAQGLLFRVDNSVKRERSGDKGHTRCTVFDLLGTIVWESDATRRDICDREFTEWVGTFDARAHYKSTLAYRAQRLREESARICAAIR